MDVITNMKLTLWWYLPLCLNSGVFKYFILCHTHKAASGFLDSLLPFSALRQVCPTSIWIWLNNHTLESNLSMFTIHLVAARWNCRHNDEKGIINSTVLTFKLTSICEGEERGLRYLQDQGDNTNKWNRPGKRVQVLPTEAIPTKFQLIVLFWKCRSELPHFLIV